MAYTVIIVVIAVVIVVALIKYTNGGNLISIAKNVSGIYEAVINCAYADKLNTQQKCFLTLVFDLMSYINVGKIKLDTITEISDRVADTAGDDQEKVVEELVYETIKCTFKISKNSEEDTDELIEKNKDKISNAIKTQLNLGTNGSICKKWMPLVDEYITDPKWAEILKIDV